MYDRIADRARRMFQAGWVDEVRRLLDEGWQPSARAFQAIGYRQIIRHLQGDWTLEEAVDDTIRATRRFAKRQETWFRREKEVTWIDDLELSGRLCQVQQLLAPMEPREGG